MSATYSAPNIPPEHSPGQVFLFSGFSAEPDAPLAYLLHQTHHKAKKLFVESGEDPTGLIVRVNGPNLWRTRRAFHRRRDWVLFLDECRSRYNLTALALDPYDPGLIGLVDRVLLAAGDRLDPRLELHKLRVAGARCECLWLDAA